MKTLIVTGVAMLFAINTLSAQSEQQLKSDIKQLDKQESKVRSEKKKDRITLKKLEGNDVSYQSKQQFISDFGNIEVKWSRSGYFDKATFNKAGKLTEAFYDYNAQLVGTVTPAQLSDIPASAQKDIAKHYKDYTVDRVIFYDDNESNPNDMLLYGSQFEDEDSYFVELSGKGKKIVLHVPQNGEVYYFSEIK